MEYSLTFYLYLSYYKVEVLNEPSEKGIKTLQQREESVWLNYLNKHIFWKL